jgi:hypothetical protein
MSKIREWNQEHPDKQLDYTDGLPDAYTNAEVESIKDLASNIYGSYDTALRGMLDHVAVFSIFT